MIDRILTSVMVSATALAVVACAPEGDAAPPASAEPPAEAVADQAPAPAQEAAFELTVEEACRRAVQDQYGQGGAAVTYVGGVISWRAPVDGGRLSFGCAVTGNEVWLTRDGEVQVVTLNTTADSSAQQEAH